MRTKRETHSTKNRRTLIKAFGLDKKLSMDAPCLNFSVNHIILT